MTFEPYPTRSGFIALGVALIAGLLAFVLFDTLLQQDHLPTIFWLLVGLLLTLALFGAALYGSLIAFKLQYQLNRNGLIIQWGLAQYLIPFDQIKRIIPGKNVTTPPTFRGLNIAGLRLGQGELVEYGPLKFHTTTAFDDSLIIVTPTQSYIISPRQPDQFIRAWQQRQTVGTTQQWRTGLQRSWPLRMPLFGDRLAQLLFGLATLICLALFGYLAFIFADLPASLPIRLDAFGQATRIAEKSTLLLFPAVGAAVLGLNTLLGIFVYYQERVAAYLLWGSTVVMQLSLWVALLQITTLYNAA